MGEAWPGEPPPSLITAPCLRAVTGQDGRAPLPVSAGPAPPASSRPLNMPGPLPFVDSWAVPFALAPVNCGAHSLASLQIFIQTPPFSVRPSLTTPFGITPPHTPPPPHIVRLSSVALTTHWTHLSTQVPWALPPSVRHQQKDGDFWLIWFTAVSPAPRTAPGTREPLNRCLLSE